jgi:5-methylcytosine-specific restriction endonuclease McrA
MNRSERARARAQGYSAKWDRYSKAYLRLHPFCCDPFGRHRGRLIDATVTGHREAHRGDAHKMWDATNHYPLCAACNAYQCATFEGGFGHERKAVPEQKPTIIKASDPNAFTAINMQSLSKLLDKS